MPVGPPLLMSQYATPVGDLAVVVTPEDSVVRAAGMRPPMEVMTQVPLALGARGWVVGTVASVDEAVTAWIEGDPALLSAVSVDQPGGPFFRDVWTAMRDVPAGQVVSYQELARMAGRPRAMRAVGTACARNAIALFVPCHRVINAGGRLGSYGFGGTEVKAAMLAHEGVEVHGLKSASATVTVPA